MRIHVAEMSVTSSCELGDRRSPSPRRRHRHLEKSVPVAGDATVAARLNPTPPCTTDESLATQDATALTGKLASRRMRARLGFPVTATMRRDVQLARARAPMLAEVLALTAARKARSRLVGNHDPKHVQITDFDPSADDPSKGQSAQVI